MRDIVSPLPQGEGSRGLKSLLSPNPVQLSAASTGLFVLPDNRAFIWQEREQSQWWFCSCRTRDVCDSEQLRVRESGNVGKKHRGELLKLCYCSVGVQYVLDVFIF